MVETTVTIYPHGTQIRDRYEACRAEGKSDAEAHRMSEPFEVAWPRGVRLPVAGDVLSVRWAHGHVRHVDFMLDEEDVSVRWEIRIMLNL